MIIFQSTLPAWGATVGAGAGAGAGADFNPRSPRGERLPLPLVRFYRDIFQSTLPAWGATRVEGARTPSTVNFNPRSPRGERHRGWEDCTLQPEISIHAPRVGSDFLTRMQQTQQQIFQSTLPAWGATEAIGISTYAEEIFQSTLPAWGATMYARIAVLTDMIFQSTLPAWGATVF